MSARTLFHSCIGLVCGLVVIACAALIAQEVSK